MIHNYTIVDFPEDNQTYGSFKGKTPKIAASKIMTHLIKYLVLNNTDDLHGKFIVFVIRDIDSEKEYKYIGNRIKLHNPVIIEKDGKKIEYKYKNIIAKYRVELDLL